MMNLHNHSIWSDGSYNIVEIVEYATKNKLQYLGISDHYLTTKISSMNNSSLKKYIEEINRLKDSNNNAIKLFAGAEIDFTPRTDFKNMDFGLLNQLDYILFENVQNGNERGLALWQLIEFLDKIEVLVGLAHTNLNKNFSKVDISSVLSLFESKNIFIELNTSPIYTKYGKYYFELSIEWFEKIKNYNIPISIGSDMHDDMKDLLNFNIAAEFISSNKLEKNIKILVDTLERISNHARY
jgi:DNA polymerase (family 10)